MTILLTQLITRLAVDSDIATIRADVGLIAILLCLVLLLRREYLRAQWLGRAEPPRHRLLEVAIVPLLPLAGLIIVERLLAFLR